jgi:predicted nucleic acid-binding protein
VIIVDTDALAHLQKRDPVGVRIEAWLNDCSDRDVRITIVTAYEMLRGAVALIERRKKERRDLIPAFYLHQNLVEYLGTWRRLILPYEEMAEQIYRSLPTRVRQELKDDARNAAIALVHGAVVWTCNVTDYSKVQGLPVVRAETGLRVL